MRISGKPDSLSNMMIHFEKDLPTVADLEAVFTHNTPLLDVRAPVEFVQGAFPMAHNWPLINDDERHQIGLRYKHKGQDEAIKLGAELIDTTRRQQRVSHWKTFVRQHPDAVLYCFRGGMRSKIAQQWLYEATGIKYPRISGGYKAMRRFLIERSEQLIQQTSFVLLSGGTGSGKTRFLEELPSAIDLEGLANHRGSAFGAYASPQPTQINFENTLAIQQLKLSQKQQQPVYLEDEGRNIGAIHLPRKLYEKMSTSPVVLLQVDVHERLQTSIQEYAISMLTDFQQHYGEDQGFERYRHALLNSLDKIQKRLGGQRHKNLRTLAEQALQTQQRTGSTEAHLPWVNILLTEYYDPMYHYQLAQKKERIIFTGNHQEVLEFIQNTSSE